MKRVVQLLVAVALVVPGAARAQDKPNFSGTWTLDASKSQVPGTGAGARAGRAGRAGRASGSGAGLRGLAAPDGPVVITQTETEITIGAQTYKLDGSPTPIGRGRITAETKAHWDGAKLVIESTRDARGSTATTKEVRSLDPEGKEMTVEMSVSVPRGEQKVKQVFTKTN